MKSIRRAWQHTTPMKNIYKTQTINIGGKIISFDKPWVMGIVNLTPDSFYDGGHYFSCVASLQRIAKIIEEGADIIDLGAFSSRPGAHDVSIKEEIGRLLPIIEKTKEKFPTLPISIDTFRAEVADKAIQAGADMINDISGGELDNRMYEVIAKHQVPYIMMHMRGTPKTMQNLTDYKDLIGEIALSFGKRIDKLRSMGIKDIILDPGFGFSKTLAQNYELLDRINEFQYFNLPILAGISRKSMIYKKIHVQPEDALTGTIALNTLLLYKGVQIIRVHDVKEAKQIINLLS